MLANSAADSVSFAIQRTREFLFTSFRWGTYLKLGLVAIICEGIGNNFRSERHRGQPSGHGPVISSLSDIPPERIAAGVAALLLFFLLCLVIFYLVTRLRFAFFHCLTYNTSEIRPGWRLYQAQAKRFFWLNIVVGFCFLLVVALISLPFIAGFVRLYHESQQAGHLDVPLLLSLVLPLIPVILVLALAGFALDVILRDWMLPHYALEDATAGEAWSSVWARIRMEQRQFLVYAVLRLILPIIAVIGLFIVFLIPGLILGGSLAAIEYSLHSAFAEATGAAALVGILLKVFFGVVAFGFALLAGICVGGPVSTAIREYALIFYGGRYQLLGDMLYPPAAPPKVI